MVTMKLIKILKTSYSVIHSDRLTLSRSALSRFQNLLRWVSWNTSHEPLKSQVPFSNHLNPKSMLVLCQFVGLDLVDDLCHSAASIYSTAGITIAVTHVTTNYSGSRYFDTRVLLLHLYLRIWEDEKKYTAMVLWRTSIPELQRIHRKKTSILSD